MHALRYEARTALMRRGRLYLAYSALKHPDRTLRRDTEIVIEGPRRSGNTFAVTAFELAQPRPVVVAHHRHASVQVVEGARRGLPVVVLARDPVDTAVSLAIYAGGRITLRQALRDYVRFYEDVVPLVARVVRAPFERVVGDFGSVIREVNARFGMEFGVFEHSDENARRCLARIEDEHVRRFGRTVETRIARPSPARAELAVALREAYEAEPAALRERAAELYALLASS